MSHEGNDSLREQEYEQQQEEAHQHFVASEFCNLVKQIGANRVFELLDENTRSELLKVMLSKWVQDNEEKEEKGNDPIQDVLTVSTRGY